MNIKVIAIAIVFFVTSSKMIAQLNLIPYPNTVTLHSGEVTFNTIKVKYDNALNSEFNELSKFIKTKGLKPTTTQSKDFNIELVLAEHTLKENGKEGYKLDITDKKITITAANPAGIFFGIQTLKQLQLDRSASGMSFPQVSIQDNPKFKWRAFMLDESRHFKGKEVVFDMLDQMALLKMNVFHWHLTDDQGWRIEIKKYPLLTQIGSYRNDTQINGVKSDKRTGKPHSGFYTQEDIKEVIAYAAKKHITIIPEIEMPGHATAAIAAYPWLGTVDKPIDVSVTFGILPNIFNVTDPKVKTFLEDVLQEVIDLFPSKIVHIGGDEVKFDQWKESEQVTEWMKDNNIKSYPDIQIAFTNSMSKFIESKGYRMMGWNDILGENLHHYNVEETKKENNEKLAQSAIIHFWKGSQELMVSALTKGHEVVNSQHNYTYLDYDYNSISLEKAYSFSPIPEGIDKNLESQVLGLGCQMWSEWVPTQEDMYRQVFPRLAAYAEVGWTQTEQKDFRRFQTNLQTVKQNWENTPYYTKNIKNDDYVTITFSVDMNDSPFLKELEGGREMLTLSGTFKNVNTGAEEYWHADSVSLTDSDYNGIYTGTKLVPKNSTLSFILLKSPDGSWDNHIKILSTQSCKYLTPEKNYKIDVHSKDMQVAFKAEKCLDI
ncbi:beta-N-acetylhexosaminidase [Formosa sediminum]|uniref:beta-N-acetylhexosaminidase n=1 Tax=Formosa sediminum TaxID=2594004 RepID=A0A516GUK2_9FLAO|nr:beta-N-acetylhexosaminidase [Formosa sediminum]QDO95175.1 beta-N-acetylhexosaminidase [Formosa sediminum]